MKTISCTVPDSIFKALQARVEAEHATCSHVIATALSQCLDTPLHTLFQVSTSAALVEGLYQGAMRVSRLLQHGDFGLGTFIDLDGEMVVLDGRCYQVRSDGTVAMVEDDRLVPYAVVTRFRSEQSKLRQDFANFTELEAICDSLRTSDNLFHAFRIKGRFSFAKARVMCAVSDGTKLREAAHGQAEFLLEDVEGTLVGLWAPSFASAFSVPGYHFHILSDDLLHGGHLLDCSARQVTIEGCAMTEIHVALPETEAFLQADLTHDPHADLMDAERNHDKPDR